MEQQYQLVDQPKEGFRQNAIWVRLAASLPYGKAAMFTCKDMPEAHRKVMNARSSLRGKNIKIPSSAIPDGKQVKLYIWRNNSPRE